MVTTVAVVGAAGRMGRLATALIEQAEGFEVGPRLGSADSLAALSDADAVVDFTVPAVSPLVVDAALALGIPALVGTSGWTGDRLAVLDARLREMPETGVIVVPNFSVGSAVATRLSTIAARYFESVEIVEAHHAGKVDSPSGTATRTAELMTAARGDQGPVLAPHADQRARGQQVASIPIHSLRLTGVEARQDVVFGGSGETLTITHETISASSYEAGILLGLRHLLTVRGLVVGLDALLGLPEGDAL